MSPVLIAAIAAVVIVALALGYKLVSQVASSRVKLIEDQRKREDAARAADAGDPVLNALGSVLDPIGLFH